MLQQLVRALHRFAVLAVWLATTSSGQAAQPVKVFVLAGQSNMEGLGSAKTYSRIGGAFARALLEVSRREEHKKPQE